MADVKDLITDNIDIWTSAVKRKSSSGRGSGKKVEIYGVKKLRELILELAVSGLLVPQDPNDEPASVLLDRIAVEKNKRHNSSGKKSRKLPNIDPGERLINQPNGWCETRLGEIIRVINGRAYKKHEMLQEGTPLLRVGNLFTSKEWYYSDLELEIDKYIDNGDLIFAWSASFGPFIWEGGKAIYHYHIWKMEFYSPTDCDKYFFKLYLQAVSAAIKASGSGIAMIHMTKDRMEKLVLPIPPLQEQHRIVAKVDELMALCDQLEQQTEASLTAHQTLVKTLLDALTQAATQQTGNESTTASTSTPFEQAWQRLAEHFDTVFTTEDSIDQLKQTILELAIMGKLTKPETEDSSVSNLINNIFEERCKFSKAKKQMDALTNEYYLAKASIDNNRARVKARFICNFITKGTTPSKNALLERSDVPFLKVYNIVNQKLDFDYKPIFVSKKTSEEQLGRSRVYPGDVIMNIVGPPLGKVAIVTDQYKEWNMNQALVVFRPVGGILKSYIYYSLSTRSTLAAVLSEVKGTAGQDNLSLEQCRNLTISLPSVEEQRRIVDIIDELTILCDQLKANLADAQITQLLLADAVTEQAIH